MADDMRDLQTRAGADVGSRRRWVPRTLGFCPRLGLWAWAGRTMSTALRLVPKIRAIDASHTEALATIASSREADKLAADLAAKALDVQLELGRKMLEAGSSYEAAKCLQALGLVGQPIHRARSDKL
jgi:hypothetical protein